jgi:ATP-dependent protease ClpP protease subunit
MKNRRTSIRAMGRTAEILIYEEIGESFFGGLGAKAFREQLAALTNIDTLTVRINSDGGDVFEGMAIYNTLKDHPAKKDVVIDGIAASIASVIAMAGDTITIQPTAMMMIHNAATVAFGDCNRLRQVADLLDVVSGQMAVGYQRSGIKEDEIRQIMDAETWYTAEAAVAIGWADSLVPEPLKMAASIRSFDLKAFKNVPEWALNAQSVSAELADCVCPCVECLDGNCAGCTDDGCVCEGCTCQAAMNGSKTLGIKAEIAPVSQEIQQKALIAARIRNENLRLAEHS